MKPSHTHDDTGLFVRAKSDPDAFTELYHAYAAAVYSWFRRHTDADPDTAADLTAEAFARALLGIRRFRGTRAGAGTAWLFAIVQHLAVDYARTRTLEDRARRRLRLAADAYIPSPAEDAAARLDAEREGPQILRAFELLSEQQQDAIRSRVVEGLTYREIAGRTGSGEQAVRLQVMRGLRRLRRTIPPPEEATPQ